jgi:hypothetical protein
MEVEKLKKKIDSGKSGLEEKYNKKKENLLKVYYD